MSTEEEVSSYSLTDISENYIVNLLERLKYDDQRPTAEEIKNLLQSQSAQQYFKFNTIQYCELISLCLNNIDNSVDFISFLKQENLFHKTLVDREDFYNNFIENLLLSLIGASSKFQKDVTIFEETSRVIQKCVFSRHLHEFDCFLARLFEEKTCNEKHSLCKTLFKFFSTLYMSTDYSSFGFKLIFYSYSRSYKNFIVQYRLLVFITQILGFDVSNDFGLIKIKYKIDHTSLNNSLNILSGILSAITKLRFDLDCKLNNVTFTDYLKNLLQSIIFLTNRPNVITYQILLTTVEINPLIIESLINEIIIYTMLNDNSESKMEYEELLIKILEVFNKLHRIQNLISKMIPTLKAGIENCKLNEAVYVFRGDLDVAVAQNYHYNVDDIFPKAVLNYFTYCIIHLASWQVINLFKTLLFHLNKAVEELHEGATETVYIEILSALMCILLQSVRMAEHTVASSTVTKFVGGLEELRIILSKFGKILLQKEHNHVLMKSFLNISYFWAEIYVTLEYYSITNEINMPKHVDNNFSACNITYLHSYLNDEEWCLISERINNFGGKECKKIMQKLMIQKWRAYVTFEENIDDVTSPIIRELSSNFDEDLLEIYTDRFVVSNIIEKLPSNIIIDLADVILKKLIEGNTEMLSQQHICESEIIRNAIFSNVFLKINKLLKQKRKHDDMVIKKPVYSKIISILASDMLLCENIEVYIEPAANVMMLEDSEQVLDIKMHEEKIISYLQILTKVPVIFCKKNLQKIFILLLLALHRDIKNGNCKEDLRKTCESLVISILQHSKFTLLNIFKADFLLKVVIENFDRYEDTFFYFSQNVFRNDNDSDILSFEPAVTYIKENIKEDRGLKYAVTVINLLSKSKKKKISNESKSLCIKYKLDLCHKLVKIIEKKDPENRLIEPYALVLKTFLAKDENDSLAKLRTCLHDYLEYCVTNLSDINLKGCLLLFTTILHNKTALSDFNEDVILRIWNAIKSINIESDVIEEYSQLVRLISTLIPNEQFSNIFGDLLKVTEDAINKNNEKEFCKHLKTWTCIVSTNFNPIKTNILREQLGNLLEKLILVLKSTEYNEELFGEVIQFEVSIVQANHVPLTAAIMDFFLLTPSILMTKKSNNFIHNFSCCMSLLESLLKYRNPLIMDRLPPYLLQYRILLKELCQKSSSNVTLQQNKLQKIADCAHKLEKLTKSLVECSKDMSRIAMYLVADVLAQYEQDTLYPNVKKHLDNCIYSLISLCDQHAVQYLMRVLSNASTEIFKFMYENYKKYYRFTGKV